MLLSFVLITEPTGDMFSCCDVDDDPDARTLDLYESASNFQLLSRLLHDPPLSYQSAEQALSSKYENRLTVVHPKDAIPFPLLPLLFTLADKYALAPDIMQVLHTHLLAYASSFPLQVYGLATRLGLERISAKASIFLLHPPLHTYSLAQIEVIPTAQAYHKLLLLQRHRVVKLRELLLTEELFPHGYGACPQHKDAATVLWDTKKKDLVGRIESGMLVARLRE